MRDGRTERRLLGDALTVDVNPLVAPCICEGWIISKVIVSHSVAPMVVLAWDSRPAAPSMVTGMHHPSGAAPCASTALTEASDGRGTGVHGIEQACASPDPQVPPTRSP